MKALFLCELQRYRVYAALLMAGQLLLLMLLGKVMILLEPNSAKHLFLMGIQVVGPAGFAILQMTLHRRKNHWAYLVHRPLDTGKIFAAVSGAGVLLAGMAFALPFALTVAYLDIMTTNVVDLRHYLYCLNMILVAATAYYLAAFATLHRSKVTFIALYTLLYLIHRDEVSAGADLLSATIGLCIAFYLAKTAFKVNLDTISTKTPAQVLSVLALQPALMVVLVLSQVVYYHIPNNVLGGKDTDVTRYQAFTEQKPAAQFSQLLEQTGHPDAEALTRQMQLAKFERVSDKWYLPPVEGQLFMKDSSFALGDQHNKAYWVFSHDLGVFVGRQMMGGKQVGLLGQQGFIEGDNIQAQDRFEQMPTVDNGRRIRTANTIYEVNFEHQLLQAKHKALPNDSYVKPVKSMFNLAILHGEKYLYLLEHIDFVEADEPAANRHLVPHPVANLEKMRITMTEVLDGYLILYNSEHMFGHDRAGAVLNYVRHEGQIEQLTELALPQADSSLVRHQQWIVSPVAMNLLDGLMPGLLQYQLSAPPQYGYFWQRNLPHAAMAVTLLLALFSSLFTWRVSAKMAMTRRQRVVHSLLNLLLGLPGLIALLVIFPRRAPNPSAAPQSRSVVNVSVV